MVVAATSPAGLATITTLSGVPSIAHWIPRVPPHLLVALSIVLSLLLVAALCIACRVVRVARQLTDASAPGRRQSLAAAGAKLPTAYRRDGIPADPLNLRITGTPRQLGAAFTAAGWYRADEINLFTATRIVLGALLHTRYLTAPVSNLYLYGRRQEYAFERPGRTLHERDHIRLWDTGERSRCGRQIWVGTATRDVALKFSPASGLLTHRIAADVDAERMLVTADLLRTSWVASVEMELRSSTARRPLIANGNGDAYFTDGAIASLTLADRPVVAPFPTTQVRGRVFASLARRAVRIRSDRVLDTHQTTGRPERCLAEATD